MDASAHIDAVVEAIVATEAHMLHEYSGDWDATMGTVHPEPRYALAQPGYAKTLSRHGDVDTHYNGFEGVVIPHASRVVTQIATDWYMFFENVPTRIDVKSGEWRVAHTATLAPVDPPFIRGEMLWERDPGPAGNHDADPIAAARSLQIHEEYLDALREGDVAALTALIDADATWAERDYLGDADVRPILELHGAARAIDYCTRWSAAMQPERVSILNRVATSWYVFAEELWTVGSGDARRQLRKAVIYPLSAEGRIRGTFGWGTDVGPLGARAGESVGHAFWESEGPDIVPDTALRGRAR